MNQRRIDAAKMIPELVLVDDSSMSGKNDPTTKSPESMMFDKADNAATIEQLRQQIDEAANRLQSLRADAKSAQDDERSAIIQDITPLEYRIETLEQLLKRAEERQINVE